VVWFGLEVVVEQSGNEAEDAGAAEEVKRIADIEVKGPHCEEGRWKSPAPKDAERKGCKFAEFHSWFGLVGLKKGEAYPEFRISPVRISP
jgi:hypothetical protein